MSILITFNGGTYIIPSTNEVGWGSNLDAYFVGIAAGCLQKTGGSFTLSAETDFGAAFGLKSLYYKSRASNVATSGTIRLANSDLGINWRNAANNANLPLTVNGTDQLIFNGVPLASTSLTSAHIFVGSGADIATDVAMTGDIAITNAGVTAIQTGVVTGAKIANTTITNANISASAAIAYSKLDLSNSIVNADISTSAAIAYSKLALSNSIVNADISTSAAIARSKLAAGTAWRVLANDTAGAITEIGFGSSGQVLTSTGATSLPTFQNVSGTGTVNSGTQYQLAYYATSTNAVSGFSSITTNASNQLLITDGTAGAPGISFTSDPDTGLYRITTNALGISAGGSLAVRIDAGNYVMSRDFLASADATYQIGAAGTGFTHCYLDDGSVSSPAFIFSADTNTGIYRIGADNLGVSCGNTKVIDAATTGVAILGTNTNNDANAGFVGEAARSRVNATNFPATGVVGDLTSIDLTPGDWDISLEAWASSSGTTFTSYSIGVSTATGNTTAGLIQGDNYSAWCSEGATGIVSSKSISQSIPSFRVSISGTNTYYYKYVGTYTGTAPTLAGRISARRVR